MSDSADHPDDKTVSHMIQDASTGYLRGFLFGFSIKSCLKFIRLAFLVLRQKISWYKFKTLFVDDTLRFSHFVGSYACIFRLALCCFHRLFGDLWWKALLGGMISGCTLALDSKSASERRVTLSLYTLVHAANSVCHNLCARKFSPRIPFFETYVFAGACSQIMYSWFYFPKTLPATYVKWITAMANMDLRLLSMLRKIRTGEARYGVRTDILREYLIDNNLLPELGDMVSHIPAPCCVVHPQDPHSCAKNAARRWARGFSQACVLYVPVHLVHMLVLRWRRFTEDPWGSVKVCVQNTVRSSAFLGTFIAVIWGSVCAHRQLTGSDTVGGPAMGSALCGLSLLLEPSSSRRREFALYVAPRALQSSWRVACMRGWVQDIPGSEVVMFSVSGGVVVHCWRHLGSPSIPSTVRWMLGFLLGPPPHPPLPSLKDAPGNRCVQHSVEEELL